MHQCRRAALEAFAQIACGSSQTLPDGYLETDQPAHHLEQESIGGDLEDQLIRRDPRCHSARYTVRTVLPPGPGRGAKGSKIVRAGQASRLPAAGGPASTGGHTRQA